MATKLCRSCGSCGFPMRQPRDFAGGNPDAAFCSTCADDAGTLRPFEEVLRANAEYLSREQGLAASAAREMAHALLTGMPAWKEQR